MKRRFRYLVIITMLSTNSAIIAQDNFYKEYKPDAQGAKAPASIIAANNSYYFSDENNNLYRIDKDGNFLWYKENLPSGYEDFKGFSNLYYQNHQLSYDEQKDHLIMVGSFGKTNGPIPSANDDYCAYTRIDAGSGSTVTSEYIYGFAQNGAPLGIVSYTNPSQFLTCTDINSEGNVFAGGKTGCHYVNGQQYEDWSFVGGKIENSDRWGYQKGTLGESSTAFWVDMHYDDHLTSPGIIVAGNDIAHDVHICKYDDDGGFLWDYVLNVDFFDIKVNAIELVQGDVVVVGGYNTGQSQMGFAARFNTTTGNISWIKTYDVPEFIEVEINRKGQLAVLYNNGGYDGAGIALLSAFTGNVHDSREFDVWQYSDFVVDTDGSYILLGFNENNVNITSDDEIIVKKIEEDLTSCVEDVWSSINAQDILDYYIGTTGAGHHYDLNLVEPFWYNESLQTVADDLECCSENLNLFPHDIVWYCVSPGQPNFTLDLADFGYNALNHPGATIKFYGLGGGLIQSGTSTSVILSTSANTCYGVQIEIVDPALECSLTDVLLYCTTDGNIPIPASKTDVYCSNSGPIELPGSTFGQNFSVQYYYDTFGTIIPNNIIDPASIGTGSYTVFKEFTDIYTGCQSMHEYKFDIINCNCTHSLEWYIVDMPEECSFKAFSLGVLPATIGIKRYRYSVKSTALGIPWTIIADVDNQSPFPFIYNYGSPYFGGFNPGLYEVKLEVWFYHKSSDNALICGYFVDTQQHEIQPCDLLKKANTDDITSELTDISVSPNPSNGIFEIQNLPLNSDITVMDMFGKVIFKETGISEMNHGLDMSNHPRGMYIVRINSSNKITTKQIIKQ